MSLGTPQNVSSVPFAELALIHMYYMLWF
jgi:hypothetical protein